jgi:pimeloyl-ACP methyl ester carboxylesterase
MSTLATEAETKVVFIGHSLGASIATVLLGSTPQDSSIRCDGLVFENGFSSIPDMVRALYPQKSLPYHYIGGLVLDRWEAKAALVAASKTSEQDRRQPLLASVPILFVSSSNDELVPPAMMRDMYETALTSRGEEPKPDVPSGGAQGGTLHSSKDATIEWLDVPGGLHEFAWRKEVWSKTIWAWLDGVVAKQ